jgi:hypothetical protein
MIRLKETKENHLLQEMRDEMRQETTSIMIEEIIIDREKDRQQILTIKIISIIEEEEVVDLTTDCVIQQERFS